MSKQRRAPSPALVISMIALFVALGSGAYAASKIDTQDIRKKAVTTPKLDGKAVSKQKIAGKAVTAAKVARDSIKSAKVQDESLKTNDYAPGSVLSEQIGEGAVGANALAPITTVDETSPPAAAPPIAETATCPPGTTVTGGGFSVTGDAVPKASMRSDNGWQASAEAQNPGETVTAIAYCRDDSGSDGG